MIHLKYWIDVDVRKKQVLYVLKLSLKGQAGKCAMKVNSYQPLAAIICFVWKICLEDQLAYTKTYAGAVPN